MGKIPTTPNLTYYGPEVDLLASRLHSLGGLSYLISRVLESKVGVESSPVDAVYDYTQFTLGAVSFILPKNINNDVIVGSTRGATIGEITGAISRVDRALTWYKKLLLIVFWTL